MTGTSKFYIALVYNRAEKTINYIHVFEEYLVAEIDTIVNLFGEGGAGDSTYVGAVLNENREAVVCITLPSMNVPIKHIDAREASFPKRESIDNALAQHMVDNLMSLLETNDEEIRFS